MKGKQPYWPDNLMKRYIRPVAKAAGIHKRIGWHTFRHTFGTLLKANGEDIKTVQELLRHANSKITLEVYTQAMTSNKRAAQSKVVRMMVPNEGAKARLGGAIRPGRNRRSTARFHCVFWMWAEVVGGRRFFGTQILEGFGLIAPLSNPNLAVTLVAIHS
jgi:hypothetical protein